MLSRPGQGRTANLSLFSGTCANFPGTYSNSSTNTLSCPTGGSRANGKIYTGLVQENGSINWEYDYSVTANGGYYAYSCLTELADGSVGLLYENAGSSALYKNIPIADIASGASVGNERVLNVPLYGEYSMTVYEDFAGYDEIDADILDISVTDNGNGSYTVIFTGKKEGTVSFTETNSGIEYTVTVAPGELVNVSLEAGQSQSFILTDDTVGHEADPDIAEAEITSALYSDILGDCPGNMSIKSWPYKFRQRFSLFETLSIAEE